MNSSREFDIIIWGATGFTGRLVAEYLFKQYGVNKTVKWAMAGRSQAKLETVRAEVANDSVTLLVADSFDEASLDAMTKRAKVICTTVGPYMAYGEKLVVACVNNQTHYCDLSGEVLFVRNMIDQYGEKAKANGTKIVPSCGFDSIPSDLGVFFVQEAIKKQTGTYATNIRMRVKEFKGEFSGGTYATMTNIQKLVMEDRSLLKVLFNPYSLNPTAEQSGNDAPGIQKALYEESIQSWIAPFVMEDINTRTVRRSHALAGFPYGKDFLYSEAMLSGDGEEGKKIAHTTAARLTGMRAPIGSPEKAALDKMMPKPGEGPNKASREAGHYTYKFFATLQDGTTTIGTVTGDMDPGYGSTSKIIAESAVCLAQDTLPDTAGVITPAIAMGEALLKRLKENAGLTFSCPL